MMLPLSFMRGAAELTVKKAPLRLVWTIFSKRASSVVPVGVLPEMPALAKTMSSLPKSLASSAKSFLRSSATVNVSAIAVRFRSQLGDPFIQCLLIATRNCDFRAFREKAGCGQADAAVASGNESLFACELHDSSSLTD